MNITVSSTIRVFLSVISFFVGEQNVYIQWESLIQDAHSNWIVDPANNDAKTAIIARGTTAYAAFKALSDAQQLSQITTFLQNYYTAPPTIV